MVANDEVDTLLFCIGNFFDGFDAAIKYDDKLHACLVGIIHTLFGYSVTLIIAVGNIIIDVGVELLQKLVDQRNGSRSIHIIISVDKNPFFLSHRLIQTVHCNIHILHKEWIMQVCQLRAKELVRLFRRINPSFYQ